MWATLGVLLIASVGLHIEQSEGLSPDEALGLVSNLADAIEARTQQTVVIDSLDWGDCSAARCLDEARARTQAEDLVTVRVIRGVSTTRIVAERHTAGRAQGGLRAQVDLVGEAAPALADLALRLFPEGLPPTQPVSAVPATPEREAEASLLPPLLLAASSVAISGVGVGFGLSSIQARHAVEREPQPSAEIRSLSDRAEDHARVANVLLSAAIIGGVAAALVWILD